MATTEIDLSGELDGKDINIPASDKRGFMALSLNMNAKEWILKRKESVQPWSEFISFNKFKVPKSVAPLGKRVVRNVEKYQSNYMFIFAGLVIFCVLTSPLLLIAIAACLGACYIISLKNAEKKLTLMGKEISLIHQYSAVGVALFPLLWVAGAGAAVFWVLGKDINVTHQYAGVGLLSFPLFWVAGAGSAVFWVIGASFFVIMLHAGMRQLEDEIELEQVTNTLENV